MAGQGRPALSKASSEVIETVAYEDSFVTKMAKQSGEQTFPVILYSVSRKRMVIDLRAELLLTYARLSGNLSGQSWTMEEA